MGGRRALGGSAHDIAEAGRELGRYDARPWIAALPGPRAVIVTADDDLVPPRKQRELAALLGSRRARSRGGHLAVTTHAETFAAALLDVLAAIRAPATLQAG